MTDYPMLTTDAVDKDDQQAVRLKKQIDDLTKAKGDKKQIAKLQKEYDALAKKIVAACTGDIKIAFAGMKKLDADLEATLGAASKRVAEARAGLAKYKKTKDAAVLRPVAGLEDALEKLQARATSAMDDYAKSWNKWREYKAKIDASLLKDFGKARTAIIDRTTIFRTKQQKVVALATEAKSIERAAVDAEQGFETDTENRAGQAQQLLKDIQAAIVQVMKKNNPETITNAVERYQEWVQMAFKEMNQQYEIRKKSYTALTATAQASNQAVTSMRRSIATTKKMFSADDLGDRRVAEIFAQLEKLFGEFEKRTKTGLTDLQEIAKILTKADARMKAKA